MAHRRAGLVIVMCGLPASGKTTTAERLQAFAGGVLIRSCDVYRELGISLPDWVRRTRGFTRDTAAYEQARDAAYVRMLSLLEEHVRAGARLMIVDAVHSEARKRKAIFDLCAALDVDPLLLWCRCDDRREVERRLQSRRGREFEPECEASDWSVFDHLAGLWEGPGREESGSSSVSVLSYDTQLDKLRWIRRATPFVSALIEYVLLPQALDHGRPELSGYGPAV